MPSGPLSRLRHWWHGRDEAEDTADDEPTNECPAGGEHEVVEVRAATARVPLRRYCKWCREDLPNE